MDAIQRADEVLRGPVGRSLSLGLGASLRDQAATGSLEYSRKVNDRLGTFVQIGGKIGAVRDVFGAAGLRLRL